MPLLVPDVTATPGSIGVARDIDRIFAAVPIVAGAEFPRRPTDGSSDAGPIRQKI
jgi:hypothetical protein